MASNFNAVPKIANEDLIPDWIISVLQADSEWLAKNKGCSSEMLWKQCFQLRQQLIQSIGVEILQRVRKNVLQDSLNHEVKEFAIFVFFYAAWTLGSTSDEHAYLYDTNLKMCLKELLTPLTDDQLQGGLLRIVPKSSHRRIPQLTLIGLHKLLAIGGPHDFIFLGDVRRLHQGVYLGLFQEYTYTPRYRLKINTDLKADTRLGMVVSGLQDVLATGDSMKIVAIQAVPNPKMIGSVTIVIDWVNSDDEIEEIARTRQEREKQKKLSDESICRSNENKSAHTCVETWDWDIKDWMPNETELSPF
ncbi:hypothetical protein M422DRAFT_45333 [Sphaerobolus stellatus SS14]|nr:hypothetical protein M422DRAFT_45333 [Sphaerobolus stellatus SS14]